MIKEGDKAPDFNLVGDDGTRYTLDSFKGVTLVLYFYPKDNTSGCTTEAQEFTGLLDQFGKDTVIVGVSPDDIESHKNFKQTANIGFLLLSDPESKIATLYGAYGEKNTYGKISIGIIRSTFIIKDGKIQKIWKNVKAKGHADKVFCELKK